MAVFSLKTISWNCDLFMMAENVFDKLLYQFGTDYQYIYYRNYLWITGDIMNTSLLNDTNYFNGFFLFYEISKMFFVHLTCKSMSSCNVWQKCFENDSVYVSVSIFKRLNV